jgi:hypothetical protein
MTYVRYSPEDIVTGPSETFWKEKALSEVEHRSAQFDQIAKCHKAQHESEREALYDVYTRFLIITKKSHATRKHTCAGYLEQVVFLEFLEHTAFNLHELI